MPEPVLPTVRRLPEGELHSARSVTARFFTCTVDFGDAGVPADLTLESAIEIVTAEKILLGAITSRSSGTLEVHIEHALL
jgi:hypothetical protein